jgi:hypothetical protein
VHRSRLFARHLPEFGWEPIIVTVHHDFYEEVLDWNLAKLIPNSLRVERVRALPTKPIRLVGDIGIRGFLPMLRRILQIIDLHGADLLYITVPSFFAAPLGRLVHAMRGIPYGIDYIDPWVNDWAPSRIRFSKAWFSARLADLLEPIAVRKASLLTGVTDGSYDAVLLRNPELKQRVVRATMPYGGDALDHETARELQLGARLFDDDGKFRILYAGTMWPEAREPLDRIFRSMAANRDVFANARFYFIGTGVSPNNPEPQIRPLAERHGIGDDLVVEHPRRIPYLDVLSHLEAADALFIFGSTKPHYTPSKLYQAILAEKPILAVLHEQSTACTILRETNAGCVLAFNGAEGLPSVEEHFAEAFDKFRRFARTFSPTQVLRERVEIYSARSVAGRLADAFNEAVLPAPRGVREGELK